MSISYTKYNIFVQDLAQKNHNLASDQLEIALSDTAPTASDTTVTNEISYTNITNGGTTGRNITTTSATQTSGTLKLILQPLTLSATGNVAQWRYIALRNKTATKVIAYYDYGSEVNMTTGSSFVFTFDTTNGTLTIA